MNKKNYTQNNNSDIKNKNLEKKSLQRIQDSEMDPRLTNFLSKFTVGYGSTFTHVSMINPKGNFNIDRNNIEKFWNLYLELVFTEDIICGIGEQPTKEMTILADIDIRQDKKWILNKYNVKDIKDINNKLDKLYEEKDVEYAIKSYQDVLKETLQECKDEHLICFVLEKNHSYLKSSDEIASGFHLHFPFFCLIDDDITAHIIPRVKEKFKQLKLFNKFDIKNPEDCIDKCIKKNWLLYGCRKSPELESYKLTTIYNSKLEKISIEEALKNFKLYDTENEEIKFTKDLRYYLPRILGVRSNNKEILHLKPNLTVYGVKELKDYKKIKVNLNDQTFEEKLEQSEKLMTMISSARADNYDEWFRIGCILYTIGNGSDKFFDLWNEFSKRTSRDNYYNETKVLLTWTKYCSKYNNYSIGSLHHYAKEDNLKAYNNYTNKKTVDHIGKCINGGHNDFAKYLYEKYGEDFVCVHLKKDEWYMYEGHGWKKDPQGHNLRELITKLKGDFIDCRKKIYSEIDDYDRDEDNEDEDGDNKKVKRGVLDKKIKTLTKIIKDLAQASFKDSVMKECREVFYRRDFCEKLNINPNLVGFNNGVYDLDKMEFREGKKDDYISFTVGYDYKEYNEDSEEMQFIDTVFSKIYVDPELRQYFYEFCASLLKGGNFRKLLLVMSGIGDNAKSVVINFIMKVLGNNPEHGYALKCHNTLLTGKKSQSSAPNPDIYRLKGKRFIGTEEIDNKEEMNIGMCKQLTGSDSITTRDLYGTASDMIDIPIVGKLVVACNNLPNAPQADPAYWNRVRVLPHESKFKPKEECPESLEEQYKQKLFPRDDTIEFMMDKVKDAFMYKMILTYKLIKEVGYMKDPEKVLKATNIYKNNNNYYLQFVNESIINDKESKITLASVYQVFKEWFRTNIPGKKVPDKSELLNDLTIRWGEPKGSGTKTWIGYRYRAKKDDDKEIYEIEIDEKNNEIKDDNEKKHNEIKDDNKFAKANLSGDNNKKSPLKDKHSKLKNLPNYVYNELQAKGQLPIETDYEEEDEVPVRLLRKSKEKKDDEKKKRKIPIGRSKRDKNDPYLLERKKNEEQKLELEKINEMQMYSKSEAPL